MKTRRKLQIANWLCIICMFYGTWDCATDKHFSFWNILGLIWALYIFKKAAENWRYLDESKDEDYE